MNFIKFISIFLIFMGFFLHMAKATDIEKLTISVSEVLNVKPEKIKLKKYKKSKSLAGIYSVEAENKKYVLKVFGKMHDKVSRKNETESEKIFSELRVGSKFIGNPRDDSFYIREFVEGKTSRFKDWEDEKNLKIFAEALKKLYAYKSEVTAKNYVQRVDEHYKRINEKAIALPSTFRDSYESFKTQYEKLEKKEGFCHTRLRPINVIISKDKKIHFINGDGCGNANIYEELGYFTLLSGVSDENLLVFLESYFGRSLSKKEIDIVKSYQKLACFLVAIKYFEFSESKKDKEIAIKGRVKNLDKMLKSKNLTPIAEIIKKNCYINLKSRKKDLVKEYALSFYKSYLSM
jgi:thiamine kinase-like enzyme